MFTVGIRWAWVGVWVDAVEKKVGVRFREHWPKRLSLVMCIGVVMSAAVQISIDAHVAQW